MTKKSEEIFLIRSYLSPNIVSDETERLLITRLIEGLQSIPGVRIYGITDPKRFEERCSTLSLRIGDPPPKTIAKFLAERGIFTWDGNYYAINLTERLGVEKDGGFLRIGFVHYNTEEEVDRVLETVSGEVDIG